MEVRKNTSCLESEQEFLHCCFKVIDHQITLAKATLFLNPHHLLEEEQACAIGHFECVDDDIVFGHLLRAITDEVKLLGHKWMIGPMNGSTWNEYRMVTSSKMNPFLLDVVTPDYYIDLFTNYGFKKLAEYKSTCADQIVVNWDKISAAYDHFSAMNVRIEGFNKDEADKEFRLLSRLCNSAFRNNFLFSPITENDFVAKMKATLPIINPRYTLIAKHENRTVGFIFTYSDMSDKSGETIVVKTLARDPEDRYRGLGSVLSAMSMKHVKDDGFTKGIHALMVNSNSSTYISKKFEAETMRTYALVSLRIE